jgi:hypothetical protein
VCVCVGFPVGYLVLHCLSCWVPRLKSKFQYILHLVLWNHVLFPFWRVGYL